MPMVVADTGPLNYLVLIGQVDLLRVLFQEVLVPRAVVDELLSSAAPEPVRAFASHPPDWLKMRQISAAQIPDVKRLDAGEAAAISLALEVGAEVVLMDDRAGVAVARGMGLVVTGTLGILRRAAQREIVDFGAVMNALQATSFRCSPGLLEALLLEYRR